MTPQYRKKMIEVALPLEAINVASAREKSIRHGHPSTLHLWWARRPLAACRAVLFASLVDDPDSDPQFRRPDGTVDEEKAGYRRAELFNLIEEMVKWENSNNEKVLNAARAEIAASIASRRIYDTKEWKKDQTICKEKAWNYVCRLAKPDHVRAFLIEHAPPVLDPFCGGGSIPLEAQRLGLRAYASDLNPVPVLINKALIEIPPKFANKPPVNPETNAKFKDAWKGAQGLAEDVRYYGKWMRDEAEKLIGHLYPKVKITTEMAKGRPDLKAHVGEELTVLAWLWTRTVSSPNPAVGGAYVPLARSFWLSGKEGKKAWVHPIIDRKTNTYRFEVRVGEPEDKSAVNNGTKIGRGCKFKCLLSGEPIEEDHIKASGMRQELGAGLLATVLQAGRTRLFVSPDYTEERRIQDIKPPKDLKGIDAPIAPDKRALWCLLYGQTTFDRLFTSRQLQVLGTLSDLVGRARLECLRDARNGPGMGGSAEEYADGIAIYLGEATSKTTAFHCTQAGWRVKECKSGRAFGRQAMPMVWDFAEVNPFADAGGGWNELFDSAAKAICELPASAIGRVEQRDATQVLIASPAAISTDPPYYDNVGYSDLADFYYVWLRRALKPLFPSLFATLVCPKREELIASPYRFDGDSDQASSFFENGLRKAFAQMRRAQISDSPLTVYYAFKQAESDDDVEESEGMPNNISAIASTGWETMLEGLITSGFAISGTWPMRTEIVTALKTNVNALASSIVLSCRPRPVDSPLATRREFLIALKRELPEALKHLQRGNIAPVDLAQASIGPGMAVFTRYAKVMEADGSPMKVRQALVLINQMLDEVLAEQEGEFDGDTRWALAWFEQYSMDDGPYGVAETLSKAKNTAVNGLVEAGVIAAKGGKVRLLKRDELESDWTPGTDQRLTTWEIAQYLILALDTGGETAAADLLRQLGGMGEVARDLAYRLYSICERKGWASEALAYNSLVIAWPEISKLAQGKPIPKKETQEQMF